METNKDSGVSTAEAEVGVGAGNKGAMPNGEALFAAMLRQGEEGNGKDSKGPGAEAAPVDGEADGAGEDVAVEAEAARGESPAEGVEGDAADEGAEAGKTGDEADDESEALKELPAVVQEKINKRIGKEVGKRKGLEDELGRVKGEFESLKAARHAETLEAIAGGALDPVEQHPKVRELRTQEQKFEQTRAAAEQLLARMESDPDGVIGTLQKAGSTVSDTASATKLLEGMRAEAERAADRLSIRRETIAEGVKEQFGAMRQELGSLAKQSYPWMEQKDSPERKMFDATFVEAPYLAALPAGEMAVADMVAGAMARRAAAAKGGKSAPAVTARSASSSTPDKAKPAAMPPKMGGRPGASPAAVRVDGQEARRRQVLKNPNDSAAREGFFKDALAAA